MPRRDDQDEPRRVNAEPLPKESPEPRDISPRDRVPERILTQILGVSHRQDARGNEGLIYAPVPLGMEEEAPPEAIVPIRWQVLRQHIEEVRGQVEDLIRRAIVGQTIKGSGFEAAATALARHALPEQGFVGMIRAGIHPQFDIIPDAASEIPWEVLEELYFSCPACNKYLPPHKTPESSQPHCGTCGGPMQRTGGKLALTYHLPHLVRSQGWAAAEGGHFLIIQDPTGGLCNPNTEAGQLCAKHLLEIQASLEQHGYRIKPLGKRDATINNVVNAIADPSAVGIYYFGHGCFPRDGNEGWLDLADGPLFASQIEEAKPTAKFVFLNTCEGAATSRVWDMEKRSRSVAEAFARGGRGRVVIASLWPMVNVQAAEAAVEFFHQASPSGPLGETLRHVRRKSLDRYQSGEAHIVWMAYRYFGDPNKTLPHPVGASMEVSAAAGATRASRVFSDNGQLDKEVFAFALDDVLLRAAKRMNLQRRTLVTITDFLVGLIRKGDLTRFVLRQQDQNPDELYQIVSNQPEIESVTNERPAIGQPAAESDRVSSVSNAANAGEPEVREKEKLREVLSRWVIRDKGQFDPGLVSLLARADKISEQRSQRSGDKRISEQDLLESLIADSAWQALAAVGLPSADEVRRLLREHESEGKIDENGAIRLHELDDSARRVIETAHVLAQQRGIAPITSRLMFAAFLADKDGYAARACEHAGVRSKLLFVLMIAASKKSPPSSFGLSAEACERIVIPVIEAARKMTTADLLITERDLFRAFCEKAGPGLKEFVKLAAPGADLNNLKLIDPDVNEANAAPESHEPWSSGADRMMLGSPEEPESGSLDQDPSRRSGTLDVPVSTIDLVHFSVTAPPAVLPKTPFVINVWAHLDRQRKAVIKRAKETIGGEINIQSRGPIRVAQGSVLSVRLRVEGLIVEHPEDIIVWEGEIGNATFSVLVPADATEGLRRGMATIHFSGLEIARIHFLIRVGSELLPVDSIPTQQKRHNKAFASYASADRDEVLARIQGIRKAAPELEVFLDVLSLRSGQYWEQELWKVIPSSDIFYLFWSENAKRSEWVEKEWRCALEARGLDFIDPVPLVSPDRVPPPPELASKHFDDQILAFIRSKPSIGVPAAPDAQATVRLLDEDASRVLAIAHVLARKLNLSPIPNRLMLAAFLVEPGSQVAQLFESHQIPASTVCAELIKLAGGKPELLSEIDDKSAQSFVPRPEASEGVVAAMLQRAGELPAKKRSTTEPMLFKAFCEVTAPALKSALKRSHWRIDLDALGSEIALDSGKSGPPQSIAKPPTSPPSAPPVPSGRDPGEHTDEAGIRKDQFEDEAWLKLTQAAQLAWEQGWTEIRTPHLFAEMIGDGSGPAGLALRRNNLDPETVKKAVLSLIEPKSLSPDASPAISLGAHACQIVIRAVKLAESEGRKQTSEEDLFASFFADGGGVVGELLRGFDVEGRTSKQRDEHHSRSKSRPILTVLGEDLTEKARRGQLADIVGRDAEIETALQTLLLTENANPLLVGESGVGKTAIVEGIAKRIVEGRCPEKLAAMRVIEVSAGALVANTRLRGEFEQRIQELLAEAREGVILFIDEIHTIVGAGSAEGSGPDAGNMLKAALARGSLRLIGATTQSEYKRTIARDKALSRRFQAQVINPPSREATIQVLSARQKTLEQHHGVSITKAAKIAAVDLSGRFILDKQWPAKARDVLERGCVLAVTKRKGGRKGRVSVTPQHIAKVVAGQTGIPLDRVSASDMSALATLEERIGKRIIGQQAAIRAITDAIRRGRQGLADEHKPWGVFLLVGPPGVGKTELAKVVAEEVFSEEDGLIRFDMGDFTAQHSAARLIGAPPGYVGYGQGAPLVELLRKRPYSLLLFDEIEHAHADVLAVLLRLFSEGTIADADGNTADARNAIIILTTNLLGPEEARRPGFMPDVKSPRESSQAGLRSLLERHLPAKFIDRIDAIINFNALTVDDLEAIARLKVEEVINRATAIYKVSVDVDAEVIRWLAEKAVREVSGARAVQRIVGEHVGTVLMAALTNVKATETLRLRLAIGDDRRGLKCVPLERH